MDRDTLIAALVGALIATVPILFSNIVQIYLHVSENRRKEREARTQLAIQLVEKDIQIIENTITSAFDVLQRFELLHSRRDTGIYSEEDVEAEVRKYLVGKDGLMTKVIERDITSHVVAATLGDEIYSEYTNLAKLTGKNIKEMLMKGTDSIDIDVVLTASRLQVLLRNKLLSIRK